MEQDPIVIVSYARTPLGAFQGSLAPLAAHQLGAHAIQSSIKRAKIATNVIDEVIMGCVLPAGQGQAPARQATLNGGLPNSCSAVTVNKMCGSGMKAVMLAHDSIIAGTNDIVIAGGMESMTNAPYLLSKARGGYRLGHDKIIDHMFLDGLEDAYEKGRLMGSFAEDTADKYQLSREQLDQFAITSLERAQQATQQGFFENEIAPVTVVDRKQQQVITVDEAPQKAKLDKISKLKPAFKTAGVITAANASAISDGAAALILMRRSVANKMGLAPIAIIRAHSTHAHEPQWFSTAPIGAIESLCEKIHWRTSDIDLFEINEAFAVVTLAAMKTLNLPADKVNIHGGACALGHPIGASGARIIVTLLSALTRYGLSKGLATLCIGGGEATAIAVEMC